MKHILFFTAALLLLLPSSFGQAPVPAPNQGDVKQELFRRSKQHKTAGTVLLIGGGTMLLVGGALWFLAPIAGLSETGDVSGAERTGKTLVVAGSTLAALSIPLFISGARAKRNATLYTGSVDLQHFPLAGTKRQMAVGIRVGL